MKILFIPNWKVLKLNYDNKEIQSPDKIVANTPYWFFKYFPINTQVSIIDIGEYFIFSKIEKKIKFYIIQPIKAFYARNKYDVVISHGAQSGLLYELLSSFTSQKPQHILFDIGGLNGAKSNKIESNIIKFALRKKPTIIIHSSNQTLLYERLYPKLLPKVKFIPFGVDFEYFKNISTHNIIGEYVMSFGYYKRDYPTLLSVWKDYKIQTCLKIVGFIADKMQYENVTFINKLPFYNLVKMINNSKIIIIPLPEYNYSYGQMSILQSMALGKVVITMKTTSTVDYIKNAPGVFAVPVNSKAALAECVMKTLSLPDNELILLGKANQTHVKKYFCEEIMAQQVFQTIKDL